MHTRTVIRLALYSRVIVVVIQFIANHLINDHDAGVFISPKNEKNRTILDVLIWTAFGGFLRWDAQYFIHIATYGYTYENTLAFFPLYPMLIRCLTYPLFFLRHFLSFDSLILLVSAVFNAVVFKYAAVTLYQLSKVILAEEGLALRAALLFCFNPASIFFSAPYTEALFSCLSFGAMLNVVNLFCRYASFKNAFSYKHIIYIIPISLSTCTRSNGVLNVGFIIYFIASYYFQKVQSCCKKPKYIVSLTFNVTFIAVVTTIICLTPFILYQMYAYSLFCNDFETDLPKTVVDYAMKNNFILQGTHSDHNQSWCHQTVPFSYSYVQNHYWDVGFLQYYSVKNLPNFFLAIPVTYYILKCSYDFFCRHHSVLYNPFFKIEKCESGLPGAAFVFVVHAFFLAVFNFLCIHVQVTTRIICSASPVLYWYCAYLIKDIPVNEIFRFRSTIHLQKPVRIAKCYFVSYFFLGIVMFCNFLPWT